MAVNLIAASAYDTLARACELMMIHRIRRLPVLGSEQRVVGRLTESNLCNLLAAQWRDENLIFSSAMARD